MNDILGLLNNFKDLLEVHDGRSTIVKWANSNFCWFSKKKMQKKLRRANITVPKWKIYVLELNEPQTENQKNKKNHAKIVAKKIIQMKQKLYGCTQHSTIISFVFFAPGQKKKTAKLKKNILNVIAKT